MILPGERKAALRGREFLVEGPSGHFRRSGTGSDRNSPFGKNFLVL